MFPSTAAHGPPTPHWPHGWGASQMEVRDRWCWSGCQPSWIQAEPAGVESNAKNCGRTELWLHLVGGEGVVWGPGLTLCLSSMTLEGIPQLFCSTLVSAVMTLPFTVHRIISGPCYTRLPSHPGSATNRLCELWQVA